jgi:hypothetical protein
MAAASLVSLHKSSEAFLLCFQGHETHNPIGRLGLPPFSSGREEPMSTATAKAKFVVTGNTTWQRERRFFTSMALIAGFTVFVGFAPTYYLKSISLAPALPLLVHIHGVLFTLWIVLLIA